MNDFLLALAVAAGGSLVMGQIDTAHATSQQQSSCSTEGGTWQVIGGAGQCYKSGQPINTQYTEFGAVVDLGVPLVAAIALTRSGSGFLGALLGVAAVFVVAIGQIH